MSSTRPSSARAVRRSTTDLPAAPVTLLIGVLVTLMWMLGIHRLTAVLEYGPWFNQTLTVCATTILATCLLLTIFRHRLLGFLGGTIAGIGAWFAAMSAPYRFDPWTDDFPGTLTQIANTLSEESAPLSPLGPIYDVVLVGALIASILTGALLISFGHPIASAVVPALLLVIPTAILGDPTGWQSMLAAGIILGLLAWISSPRPTGAALVGAGAAVALAAGVLSISPPSRSQLWNQNMMLSPVSSTVPDVTVTLANDLRQQSSVRAFSYSTTDPGSHRFTLATLTYFDDGRWVLQDELTPVESSVANWRTNFGLAPEDSYAIPPAHTVGFTITINGLVSSWLPLPQSALHAIRADHKSPFDADQWLWTDQAATALSKTARTHSGQRYTARAMPLLSSDARDIDFNGETDRFTDSRLVSSEYEPYLQLPDGIPETLSRAAQAILEETVAAEGSDDRLAVGLTMERWLSSNFVYDEAAPYDPTSDPDDPYAVVEALLTQRRGFCVHYATAFTILARELGIPTRLAVGYASRTEPGDSFGVVLGRDLHAWPEIFINGVGWVAFEPTPGGAGIRANTGDDASTETDPEPNQPQSDSPQRPEHSNPDNQSDQDDPSAGANTDLSAGIYVGIGVLGATLLLSLPALTRMVRRYSRKRAVTRGRLPAQRGWSEFVDTAVDLGLLNPVPANAPTPRAQTPEALIENLQERGILQAEASSSAQRLAEEVSAERYGPTRQANPNFDIGLATVQSVSALRINVSAGTRIRAMLFPRSVWSRRK